MSRFDEEGLQSFLSDLQSGALSYEDAKLRYRELGDAIRHRYEREISALSVDVVHSEMAKGHDPLDAQVTFDAYHHWVEEVLLHYGCDGSYTWSGDGLMAIFTRAEAAVAAGRNLLDSLAMFNARYNRTGLPLQIRVGAHTGPILTDEAGGISKIASRTFDIAGHLQKSAAPNQMRISETMFTLLNEGGGEFIPIPVDFPTTGACFAYPPHITLMGNQTLGGGAQDHPRELPAPPPPSQHSLVPWFLAAGGIALGVGVLLAVTLLWPKLSDSGSSGASGSPGTYRREPNNAAVPAAANAPSSGSPQQPVVPSQPGSSTTATPAAAIPTTTTRTPVPTPREWEPSRQLYRSADADSGLPPRMLPSPPERKWLLSIGVGAYQDSSVSSPGAGTDAATVAGALQRAAGVPPGQVRLVVDGQATRDGIKRAFQWLQQNAISGNDTVFVYITGMAMLAPDRADLKHPGGSGYALLPHDTQIEHLQETAIYGADIGSWLAATRSQAVVLFLDTNNASGFDVPTQLDPGRRFALVSAAGVVQQARQQIGRQGGNFANELAAAVGGAADANRDGRVDLAELKPFLELQVGRATMGAQTPDLLTGFGGGLPELFFSVPR